MATHELTIEAWVTSADVTQKGPARIVSISNGPLARNVTLGQGLWGSQPGNLFDVRLRTTATTLNGTPSLSSPAGTVTTSLTHVVFTRNASGETRLYVNGSLVASGTAAGDLSGWDLTHPLLLGNEISGDRPWLGKLHLVAIYDRALTPAEINGNYAAGPEG